MKRYKPLFLKEDIQSRKEIRKLADILIKQMPKDVGVYNLFTRINYNTSKAYGSGLLKEFISSARGMKIELVVSSKSGATYVKTGDHGRMDFNYIELYMEDQEGKLLGSYLQGNASNFALSKFYERFTSPLIHELTHAYDDWRSKGHAIKNVQDVRHGSDSETQMAYLNSKHEVDARFAQFISEPETQKKKLTKDFKAFKIYMFNDRSLGYSYLTKENQNYLLNKSRKEYDELTMEEREYLLGKALSTPMWDAGFGEYIDYKRANEFKDSRIQGINLKREILNFMGNLSKGKIDVGKFRKANFGDFDINNPYGSIWGALSDIFVVALDPKNIEKNRNKLLEILRKEFKLTDKDLLNIYNKYFKIWGVKNNLV